MNMADARTFAVDNARPRRDISGRIIDAHDGCLERFGGRFFLYGTAYGDTDGWQTTNRIVCYSSADGREWTDHGPLLRGEPDGIRWRPYVVFNPATRRYVLWFYWLEPKVLRGRYAVATSECPEGPFDVRTHETRTVHGNVGDLGLFVDDDGSGYLAGTSLQAGHGVSVERLAPDFLDSTMETSGIVATNCEAPAMFKRGGVYYLLFDNTCCFCSAGTGARVYTADAPLGPFEYRGNINRIGGEPRDLDSPDTPPGSGRPDVIIPAQQSHIAVLPARDGLAFVWIGDRWGSAPDGIKGHDFQVWLPLDFDADGLPRSLAMRDEWTLPL